MMLETGCRPTTSKAKLRFEALDFSDIPGQSRLFLQYQTDPLSLRKYYPSVVGAPADIASRSDEVLDTYSVDRTALCKTLTVQNLRFESGPGTFENIKRLERSKTVAVLTGQQTGLFTGPLYTIYKALSAIKMAATLCDQGIDAVPVFWAATEDHDFEEISRSLLLDRAGMPLEFALGRSDEDAGRPVGSSVIPEAFAREQDDGGADQPWQPGQTIADAFCRDLQRFFKDYGLIVVDPLDAGLKALAAPIYSQAIDKADEIVATLVSRSEELVADGYHAQVLVNRDYFPLFYHTDDGVRRAVKLGSDGFYRAAGTKLTFNLGELSGIASRDPERFSPGVMLRPVVQDYLFPTVCYFGGAAEIAYFAQNSEVYRILDRPSTPILHRQSVTVIEARHARTLEKYELDFSDLFSGLEALLPGIVGRFLNPTTERLFADVEEQMNLQLHHLDQELSRLDPTLADNLATRRRKILYHIAALQKKFRRMQVERDEVVNRRLTSLFDSLLPDGQLQERVINVRTFTSRYGNNFIDWVYESIDLDDARHRLLYL